MDLEARGLMSALEELAASVANVYGITCASDVQHPVLVHDHLVATHLFRIAQEAINNATRHGKASVINIRLSSVDGSIKLAIEDNGGGVPKPLPAGHGMGLSLMQYRAGMIGGQLVVAPRPGGGTIVACSFHQQPPI